MSWIEEKKNLKTLCSICKSPAGLHGACDGHCPRGETYFKAYKDRRTKQAKGE